MLSEKAKFAYSALVSHANRGTLALMECLDRDGNAVPVLCVVRDDATAVPVAQLLPENENPFSLFQAPQEQYLNFNVIHGTEPVPELTN